MKYFDKPIKHYEAMEKHTEKQLTKRWENNEKSWKHI